MKRTIKVGIIQQTCSNDIRHNLSKLHHNIEPVSYTHLDVYKRQDEQSMSRTYSGSVASADLDLGKLLNQEKKFGMKNIWKQIRCRQIRYDA